ncbi:hypothetical protein ONS95_009365 [Cadophora gregata]|uniref:uncharacterized protein n=1 Tax=Cadophora gregata TaxID=51156 RepID=UPI0026DAD0E7|nr:uncharacterized protein ONS95_009365 [Cadophora gregata]KAK0124404.1 hypothetical protein ONS95_009365 [Cadophora gregata]KAK0129744.1 hypothetical protein ONS96_000300 [Cadophora gregata f. sp. sojae]
MVPSTSKRPASRSLERPNKMTTIECIAKIASGRWVDLIVGPEKKEYKLPADILAHYSPFFNAAINGPFQEGQGGLITLPEDHTGDIEAFVDFVITGSVDDALDVDKWGDEAIERCVSFLVYAKKYDLDSVDDLVYRSLKQAQRGR